MEGLRAHKDQRLMKEDEVSQASLRTGSWTVGRKLALGFAVLMLLFVAISAVSFITIGNLYRTLQENFDKLTQDTLIELQLFNATELASLNYQCEMYEYILSGEEEEELQETAEELQEVLIAYSTAGQELEEEEEQESENEMAEVIKEEIENLSLPLTEIADLREQGTGIEEISERIEELEEPEQALKSALEEARASLWKELDEQSESLHAIGDTIARVQGALVIMFVVGLTMAVGVGLFLHRSIVYPVRNLTLTMQHVSAGDLQQVTEVSSKDEIGVMTRAFNMMITYLRELLQRERDYSIDLEEKLHLIEAQRQSIQELSTPVIPVISQIIVMPLIGAIDSRRAQDILRALLSGIREHRAKVVILDLTGVPIIDTAALGHLNKAIQAVQLKGASVIITGISDAMVETMIDLGIDWNGIQTLRDLQAGVNAALGERG